MCFRVPFNVKLDCSLNFSDLPYDQHECIIGVFSNIYRKSDITLRPMIQTADELDTSAWSINNISDWDVAKEDLIGGGTVVGTFNVLNLRDAHLLYISYVALRFPNAPPYFSKGVQNM